MQVEEIKSSVVFVRLEYDFQVSLFPLSHSQSWPINGLLGPFQCVREASAATRFGTKVIIFDV